MKRNQLTAVLFAIVLFCCGAAAGALAHRYYASSVVSAKSSDDFRHRYIAEMQSRLHLTSEQVAELQKIMDDTKAKYKAVRDAYRPEMLKIKADHTSRVKSILTPEQVPEYEQLVAEHERRGREQDRDHDHEDHGPGAR